MSEDHIEREMPPLPLRASAQAIIDAAFEVATFSKTHAFPHEGTPEFFELAQLLDVLATKINAVYPAFNRNLQQAAGFTPTAAPRSCEPDKGVVQRWNQMTEQERRAAYERDLEPPEPDKGVEPLVTIASKGDFGKITAAGTNLTSPAALSGLGEVRIGVSAAVVSVDRKELEDLRKNLDYQRRFSLELAEFLTAEDISTAHRAARQPAPPSGRETP